MFHFPRLASPAIKTGTVQMHRVAPFGHLRVIAGLVPFPEPFADLRVLHRLPAPWHPPCALVHLTIQPRKASLRSDPQECLSEC